MRDTFAERLRRRDRLLAAGVGSSAVMAELLAAEGFDWLFIDAETLPLGATDVQHMIWAAGADGAAPVVRLNGDDPGLIRQTLDMGAAGVIVPLVRSADQAKRIVNAAKYPPLGERGIAAARVQAYGGVKADFVACANRETAIIVMVEERDGLESVERIAATEGLDGIFVGPGDLSLSLGCFGEPMHERMRDAYRRIAAAARSNGVALGTFPVSREMHDFCSGLAFSFFLCGIDTGWVRGAAAARLQEMRAWVNGGH